MDEYLRVDLITFEKATVEVNEKYSVTIASYSYLNNKAGQLLRKDGSFSPLTIESGMDLPKEGFAGCIFEINRFFLSAHRNRFVLCFFLCPVGRLLHNETTNRKRERQIY